MYQIKCMVRNDLKMSLAFPQANPQDQCMLTCQDLGILAHSPFSQAPAMVQNVQGSF